MGEYFEVVRSCAVIVKSTTFIFSAWLAMKFSSAMNLRAATVQPENEEAEDMQSIPPNLEVEPPQCARKNAKLGLILRIVETRGTKLKVVPESSRASGNFHPSASDHALADSYEYAKIKNTEKTKASGTFHPSWPVHASADTCECVCVSPRGRFPTYANLPSPTEWPDSETSSSFTASSSGDVTTLTDVAGEWTRTGSGPSCPVEVVQGADNVVSLLLRRGAKQDACDIPDERPPGGEVDLRQRPLEEILSGHHRFVPAHLLRREVMHVTLRRAGLHND
jgi:hypothetical protein